MADYTRAAEEIRNFARRFTALLETAADLEALGTLQASAAEAEARKVQAEAAAAAAAQEVAARAEAVQEAAAKVEAARAEEVRIVAAAEQEASRRIATADGKIAARLAAASQQEIAVLDNIRTKQQELVALQSQIEENERLLREQQGELNRLRAEAARFAAGGQP